MKRKLASWTKELVQDIRLVHRFLSETSSKLFQFDGEFNLSLRLLSQGTASLVVCCLPLPSLHDHQGQNHSSLLRAALRLPSLRILAICSALCTLKVDAGIYVRVAYSMRKAIASDVLTFCGKLAD
jgi:hypothetical protein